MAFVMALTESVSNKPYCLFEVWQRHGDELQGNVVGSGYISHKEMRPDAEWGDMGAVVSISGRITTDTSDRMRSSLADTLRSKPDTLTVDLSQVDHMDTSGLATLIEAMRIARKQDTQLVLRGVQEQPRYSPRSHGA